MAKRKKKPDLIRNIKTSTAKNDLKPTCYGSWEIYCDEELCGVWYKKCRINTEVKQ